MTPGLRRGALLAACVLGLAGAPQAGAETEDGPRILFVGNSYLGDNGGVARHLARMIAAGAGPASSRTQAFIRNGSFLHERDIDTLLNRAGPVDLVILQGHSTTTTTEARLDRFLSTLTGFEASIRAHGARAVLYRTPAYTRAHHLFRADMDARIETGYASAGARIGAPVIPVGRAFAHARAIRPDLALHQSDGSHPTLAGTYLAAATTAVALFGAATDGSAYRMDGALDPPVAEFLWNVARATIGECHAGIAEGMGKPARDTYLLGGSFDGVPQC